jgi:hypothetical protein
VRSSVKSSVLLFLFVLAIVGPIAYGMGDQQASRYALTAALWENGTVRVDGFEQIMGLDAALRDGHYYSDKAPLQQFIGVPFYGIYRAVGGESAAVIRDQGNLGLWWQTLWCAGIPLAILAVLIYQLALRFNRRRAMQATLGIITGTILLPFGTVLFAHVLTALFITGAFVLLISDEVSTRALIGAGALAGAAVASEYGAAVAVAVLCVYAVWRFRRQALWVAVGSLPLVVFLGSYHAIAFGSPFATSESFSIFWGVVEERRSFFAPFRGGHLPDLFRIFFAGRGLFVATPIVALALVGLVWTMRHRRGVERQAALVALAMFVGMVFVVFVWADPWGGSSPGPRYLTGALPPLVLGVGAAWSLRPLWTRAAVAVSVLTMGLATIAYPLISHEIPVGLGTWIQIAALGHLAPSIFTMMLGNWGMLIHAGLVAGLGVLLYRWERLSRGGAVLTVNEAVLEGTASRSAAH